MRWLAAALALAACDPATVARVREQVVGAEAWEGLDALRAADGELGRDEVTIEDPSGHALEALGEALRRAHRGEGRVSIAVYGGSHTAGDLYTGRMREVLQARFGDAGHGFVPLVPVVVNHWAWGVVIDDAEGFEVMQVNAKRRTVFRYGLAGAAFLADEPEAFAGIASDHWGNGRLASRLDLLYDRAPGGGTLEVWLDGRRVDALDTAADPPQHGLQSYEVSDAPHQLEVRARGDGPVTVYGVVMERDAPGVLVHNLGLVGSKARNHLLWDEAQWASYFTRLEADLVIFAYGNNETDDTHLEVADHERQLRDALARVRRAAPEASCLLVGPTDRVRETPEGPAPLPLVAEMTEMQRRVARDLGCGFFDTLAFMGGLGGGLTWLRHDPPYLGPDHVHLGREGYLRLGEALVRSLLLATRPPA